MADPITFKNKIRDNEHEASTLSEMTIYCEFPQLRKHSFQHEIFVDRFLFHDCDHSRVDVRMIQRWRGARIGRERIDVCSCVHSDLAHRE